MKYWRRCVIQSGGKSIFLPAANNVNAALNPRKTCLKDEWPSKSGSPWKFMLLELLYGLVWMCKCQSDGTKMELESPLQKKWSMSRLQTSLPGGTWQMWNLYSEGGRSDHKGELSNIKNWKRQRRRDGGRHDKRNETSGLGGKARLMHAAQSAGRYFVTFYHDLVWDRTAKASGCVAKQENRAGLSKVEWRGALFNGEIFGSLSCSDS